MKIIKKMEIKTTFEIRMFKMDEKKKWVAVDDVIEVLSKFKKDTPLSVIISELHDEGLTKHITK